MIVVICGWRGTLIFRAATFFTAPIRHPYDLPLVRAMAGSRVRVTLAVCALLFSSSALSALPTPASAASSTTTSSGTVTSVSTESELTTTTTSTTTATTIDHELDGPDDPITVRGARRRVTTGWHSRSSCSARPRLGSPISCYNGWRRSYQTLAAAALSRSGHYPEHDFFDPVEVGTFRVASVAPADAHAQAVVKGPSAIVAGQPAVFSATVSGQPAPTCQWALDPADAGTVMPATGAQTTLTAPEAWNRDAHGDDPGW